MSDEENIAILLGADVNENVGIYVPGKPYDYLKKVQVGRGYFLQKQQTTEIVLVSEHYQGSAK